MIETNKDEAANTGIQLLCGEKRLLLANRNLTSCTKKVGGSCVCCLQRTAATIHLPLYI
jgi:hypothetical protein